MKLGLRSGTNGSIQNDVLQNNVASVPVPVRKLPKGALYVREKERILPFICRNTFRGKVVVLLSSVLALFIFTYGSFIVNKVNDDGIPTYIHQHIGINNENQSDGNVGQNVHTSARGSLKEYAALAVHQCDNFAFPPPPPPNRKRIGPRPCPVCYLPVELAIASMPSPLLASSVIRNIAYVQDENPTKTEEHGGSEFGGYPSLEQRSDSFTIKEDMTVHCGFVKGSKPGRQTGFDIDEADRMEFNQFHDVIVASAIFGNYDTIQHPENISEAALGRVPFYMFTDEKTEAYMKNSSILNSSNRVGIWRVIVVRNLPYTDPRRNGKIPKLLLHRLFPNVRYSIWIDGKLKLVVDPYQVLERFLWRQNATFAISRHYSRFDVFEEAAANKAAGKYDNASIDYQVNFYRDEGLTPYSSAKLPITSDVPEGCVLLRAHDQLTNLASCAWFNEVDRFTSRDQLSFSTVRDKIPEFKRAIHMFLDCERRNFVLQAYHRGVIPRPRVRPPPPPPPPPPRRASKFKPVIKILDKKNPKHGKGKRHRKMGSKSSKTNNSSQELVGQNG